MEDDAKQGMDSFLDESAHKARILIGDAPGIVLWYSTETKKATCIGKFSGDSLEDVQMLARLTRGLEGMMQAGANSLGISMEMLYGALALSTSFDNDPKSYERKV